MNKINYIIEDNIDFFNELKELNCLENENNKQLDEKLCLISYKPLDKNSIKLECGHQFDFQTLYMEIIKQKCFKNRFNTDFILKTNQIKCPYCRNVQHTILPHIKINSSMNYIHGVNSPVNYCMDFHKCNHTFKSGKNKNSSCMSYGFYKDNKCFCLSHHKINEKSIRKKQEKICCKAILKTGKNKGQTCTNKAKNDSEYCSRHIHLED